MIRAVICDDETAAQRIISYFIESEGLPIQITGTASNGAEALSLIEREKPDLAFLDIQMPTLDGFEIIGKLKDSNTKVIVVTVYNTFSYAQRALRLGVCDIIAKPIDMEQLRQAIIRAVGWNFTPNDMLNTALFYIYQHYTDTIAIADLSGAACCTNSHIAHLFKKYLDMTAVEYINKIRIDKAAQLLRAGSSIKEAAFAVGYKNLNNFYKYFKLYMGKTPALY
ncbi:putative two-component response regulator [Oscillibacter valericigenes Sjm18-20]|nr:putative two-component response regulator [Oscillibacter valericigenes Sjm18-20]